MAEPAGRVDPSANYQTLDQANRPPLTTRQRFNRNLAIRVAMVCGFLIAGTIIAGVTKFDKDRPGVGFDGFVVACITGISAFPLSGERMTNRNIILQAVGLSILWGTLFGGVSLLNVNPAAGITLLVLGELLGSALALRPVVVECRHRRAQNSNSSNPPAQVSTESQNALVETPTVLPTLPAASAVVAIAPLEPPRDSGNSKAVELSGRLQTSS